MEKKIKKNKTNNDPVNHPTHYTSHPSGIECIEITRHYIFSVGNAIKYLWRAGLKQEVGMEDREKEIQDLHKAIWYINDRIKQLEKKEKKMTKKEYIKFHSIKPFDAMGKPIEIGDTVVINNNYGSTPYIGKVDHFTEGGRLAIIYDYNLIYQGTVHANTCEAYRLPETVIKISS